MSNVTPFLPPSPSSSSPSYSSSHPLGIHARVTQLTQTRQSPGAQRKRPRPPQPTGARGGARAGGRKAGRYRCCCAAPENVQSGRCSSAFIHITFFRPNDQNSFVRQSVSPPESGLRNEESITSLLPITSFANL